MTIALIQIPHHRKPSIGWYDDRQSLIDLTQQCAARDHKEGPTDFEQAVSYLCKRFQNTFVIESVSEHEVIIHCDAHELKHVTTTNSVNP